jgi:7-cyano-7-deazaguanine reductase
VTLRSLGNQVGIAERPSEADLETFDNPRPGKLYAIRLSCPEFTSLCPVTGQPDFANLYIDYVPDTKCVESKSLKLFLTSFRNHGEFHEACTLYIADRLMVSLNPKWLRITAIWFPRGGIPIDVFYQSGERPYGLYLPSIDLTPYRGR